MLALAGVTILSFDSLLVKLVVASPWDLLFWQGILLSATLLLVTLLSRRAAPQRTWLPYSYMTYLGGLAYAVSMVFFVLALGHTQVASALVISNTAPFFAALIGLLALKEKLPTHTVLAIGVATAGIWIIFEYAPVASELRGDCYALLSALGTAGYLVIMRAARGKSGADYLIVAGVIIALMALVNGAEPMALKGSSILFMAVLGCLVVPASGLCIAKAPKYLPAAQTGLIMLLEILLGPLFVYCALGEQPSNNDIMGGTLVLLTLIAHTLWELRLQNRAAQTN